VLAAAGDWPKGKTKAIGKPELELLKAKLTEVHKAKARIRGSLAHETLAGVPVGFAVYEVTLFDACVGKATDPKAAKRECRAELRGDEEQGEPSQLLCTEQYVVRVSSFAPLEIGAPEGVTKGCSLKVQKIAAHDYDGDGEDEVLIDAIGTTSTPEYRTAGEDAFMRLFRVMRLDGTTQLSIDVEWQYSEGISRGEAQRFAVRDEQGKGRLDLIVSYLDFTLNDEPATPWILWPTPGPDGLPEGDELGAVHTEMWPYDAAKDEWVKPPRAE
jgi:hypothetical protein